MTHFKVGQRVEVANVYFEPPSTGIYKGYYPNDEGGPHLVEINGKHYFFRYCRAVDSKTASDGFTRSDILGGMQYLVNYMIEKVEATNLDTDTLKQIHGGLHVCKTYVQDLKKMENK